MARHEFGHRRYLREELPSVLVLCMILLSVFLALPVGINRASASAPSNSYPWKSIGPVSVQLYFSSRGYENASGHIGLIAIESSDPNTIYIASGTSGPGESGPYGQGGVYRTSDGGKSWTAADLGLPYDVATSLYMNQTNPLSLLVGFSHLGIYKTTDGGGYWFKVSDFAFSKDFTAVFGALYAGSESGVIKSVDGGSSWILVESQPYVRSISISGNTIYAYSSHEFEKLFKSADLGVTWSTVYSFSSKGANNVWGISASPFNASIVYAFVGGPSSNWVSQDGGRTFSSVPILPNLKMVVFDPVNQSRAWAYGPGYLGYSKDGGASFIATDQGTDNMGLTVDSQNDNLLVLGSDQGVYESTNAGRSWHSISGNLSDFLLYSVSASPDGQLVMAGVQDYSGFISHDGGVTWTGGTTGMTFGGEEAVAVVNPGNPSWVYAIHTDAGLLVSNDGGLTFATASGVTDNSAGYQITKSDILVDPYDQSRIYVGTSNGVYSGTNFGASWLLMQGSPANVTAVGITSTGSLIVGTWNSGMHIYRTGNWAKSSGVAGWTNSVSASPVNQSVVIALVSDPNPLAPNLYLSTDGGVSYAKIMSSGQGIFQSDTCGVIPYEGVGFLNVTSAPIVANSCSGIYVSTDRGTSWKSISYNLHSGEITDFDFKNGKLYASTFGEGVMLLPNFSLFSLPATLNGYISASSPTVTVNGSSIITHDGHFQVFLNPGHYQVVISSQGVDQTYDFELAPMQVYNLNATISSTTTTTETSTRTSTSASTSSVSMTSTTSSTTGLTPITSSTSQTSSSAISSSTTSTATTSSSSSNPNAGAGASSDLTPYMIVAAAIVIAGGLVTYGLLRGRKSA